MSRPKQEQTAAEAIRRATLVQRAAADVNASVALRASAGSGKTKVLVDRFIRLCLTGSRPKAVLAVTFTRKAAVEIKGRLLRQARRFALLQGEDLDSELYRLLGVAPTARQRDRAGQLFEEILEDLAGLQVGTIHSFCQQILGRFPGEVGLDPRFKILESEDLLWEEALDRLEVAVAGEPELWAELAALAPSPAGVRSRLTRLLHDRVHLDRWLDRLREQLPAEAGRGPAATGGEPGRRDLWGDLAAELKSGLFAGTDLGAAREPALTDLAPALAEAAEMFAGEGLDRIAAGEAQTTAGFAKQARVLREALNEAAAGLRAVTNEPQVLSILEQVVPLVLTAAGKLRVFNGKKDSKATRQVAFAEAAAPLLSLLVMIGQLELFGQNRRLLRFGLWALDIYDGLKRRDRCVDFHDLERLAHRLMQGEQAAYLQYRLDEMVDHLLVDEFQDTNRNQWGILQPFAQEFLAGDSARSSGRTVFLVGDPKQSIYAFRGAEPALFTEVAGWLAHQGQSPTLDLPANFRSLSAVVRSVGRLFTCQPLEGAWPAAVAASSVQEVARPKPAGRVFIMPPFPAGEQGVTADRRAADSAVQLVKYLTAPTAPLRWIEGKPTFGDILVLCRNRTHITTYEEAFRRAGIPIVPAGRGLLALSREVRDLLILLRWLVYPNDDAALASVLRSPIFRVDESTLQSALAARVSAGRGKSLWSVLRGLAGDLQLEECTGRLTAWRDRVGFAEVHDLLREIFTSGQLMERYAVALGEQARFNLLRLFDLALSSDLGDFPTVRGLADLIQRAAETAAEEVATLPAGGTGRIRLMTVHGAKGLEAPVVLLVDADAPLRGQIDRLDLGIDRMQGPLLYDVKSRHWQGPSLPAGAEPLAVGPVGEAGRRAESDQRREEADILYVAMTRARDALFVLGGEGVRKGGRESFLDWLQQAASCDRNRDADGQDDSRETLPYCVSSPQWLQEVQGAADGSRSEPAGAPSSQRPAEMEVKVWEPPPQPPAVELVKPPSTHQEHASRSSEFSEDTDPEEGFAAAALDRGTFIHLCLQLAAEGEEMPPGDPEAVAEARAVVANPEFAWIFFPEKVGGRGLAEVSFIRRLDAGRDSPRRSDRRVLGTIDRLVLRPGQADIIDYKSDRKVGNEQQIAELVGRYGQQMSSYREAVQRLYPDREVNAHLLLTHAGHKGGQGRLVPVTGEAR